MLKQIKELGQIRKDKGDYKVYAIFECSYCKKEVTARVQNAQSSKSCGCQKKRLLSNAMKKHGMINTPEYNVWRSMKSRCNNKKLEEYKDYGGRGIKVCDRWEKFENFYTDMGDRPDGYTLERVDNSKGYSKENCRWATRREQMLNTRKSRFITWNGKTQTISEWAEELGIAYETMNSRIFRNGVCESSFLPLQREPTRSGGKSKYFASKKYQTQQRKS